MTKYISNEIKKSPNDTRKYRALVLNNDLTVLIISDSDTNSSASALCVGVGSLSDGKVAGLAHYLEHMLFMGSEKYPDEEFYHKIVAQYGGGTNAYTAHDHTNYHFYVDPVKFFEVLDVFAQFFIKPLFRDSALEREMNAVSAEHKKNINNDDWRLFQMKRQLSPENSPLYNFSTGTLETLNINNIHEKVIQFYNSSYSANNMTLVVLAKEPLDEIQQNVERIFLDIPNKNIKVEYNFDKIFEYQSSMIEMIPIKNEDTLVMYWDVEDDIVHKKSHILNYITHMLGHEGNNTLTDLLKKKYWIEALYAGTDGIYGGRTTIQITFVLTTMGKEHISEIINAACKYVDLIKQGVSDIYYKELHHMAEQKFIFSDKAQPESFVTHLSSKIQLKKKYIEIENVLSSSATYDDFFANNTANILKKYLGLMTIDKLHIIFSSQAFRNKTLYSERWYGIEYNKYDNLSKLCLNNSLNKNLEILNNLQLPIYNLYVPNSFEINMPNKKDHSTMQHPDKMLTSDNITLYYKYNTLKQLPKTNVAVSICSEWLHRSKYNYVALQSYIMTLEHMTNSTNYLFQLAGYTCAVSAEINKLIFAVFGMSHKIGLVIDKVISNFLTTVLDEQSFDVCKSVHLKNLQNHIFDAPYIQSSRVFNEFVFSKYISPQEHIEILSNLTFQQVSKAVTNMLSERTCVRCFVSGNESLESAHVLCHKFSLFAKKDMFEISLSEMTLPRSFVNTPNVLLSQSVTNSKETNSVIIHCTNIGHIRHGVTKDWCKTLITFKIFDSIIGSRFFDQLRTKEQLGYIAKTSISSSGYHEYPLYVHKFLVQSPTHCATALKDRVNVFISTINQILTQMTNEEFMSYVNSEINYYKCPFNSLKEEFIHNMDIFTREHDVFDQKILKIKELEKITKDDLISFFNKYYTSGTSWTILLDGSVNCKQ